MGTRYAGGVKLHTIGPAKNKLEKFWNDHIWCGGDNVRKSAHPLTATWVDLKCRVCGITFTRNQSYIDSYNRNHNKTGQMYCSKKCNGLDNN